MRSLLRKYGNGGVPLSRVFWFDMMLVGTIVNAAMAAAALVAFATGAPDWLALGVFFAPFPYNLTLCFFVWRSAARHPSGWSNFAKVGAVLWFAVMLVV